MDGGEVGEQRPPAGRALAPSRHQGGAALAPDAPAPRPVDPDRAPAPTSARTAGARLWHEIGCSRNESAPRGGG